MEIPQLSLDGLIQYVKHQHPDDSDALPRLSEALLVSTHVTEQADNLVGHFVDQARRSGASWSEIGASMGVTKQAAQKRFVPRWGDDLLSGGRTFDRFTDRARGVVATANRIAAGAGAAEIEPQHVGLGLFAEPEGLAARLLAAGAISQAALSDALGHTAEPADLDGSLALSAATVVVLESALSAALRLGHNFIGTEHLLLGLLARPDLDVTVALARLGATTEVIEPQVVELLTGPGRSPRLTPRALRKWAARRK